MSLERTEKLLNLGTSVYHLQQKCGYGQQGKSIRDNHYKQRYIIYGPIHSPSSSMYGRTY